MHLWDQPNGFYGSTPIVAGTVPLAVGAAMAAKMQNTNDIGVAYIGDGSAEEGVVHESLNLARILMSPVLFVIENNMFASHMHISLRQPCDKISRFAIANDITNRAACKLLVGDQSEAGALYIRFPVPRWCILSPSTTNLPFVILKSSPFSTSFRWHSIAVCETVAFGCNFAASFEETGEAHAWYLKNFCNSFSIAASPSGGTAREATWLPSRP